MGIKRVVDTSFWTDGKVDEFSPEDKYFMLYLLTNPFSTQLGIYELSIKQAAFQMGYSVETVKVLIDRFQSKYGIILFSESTNEIAIKNFLRHSIIKGGAPVRDCLVKEIKKVKNRALLASVFAHVKQYDGVNETVANIVAEYEEKNGDLNYCNEKKNENVNENENDNEVSSPVSSNDTSDDTLDKEKHKETIAEIIAYLNEKTGKNYRASGENVKKLIRGRLAEGYTLEDFKTVIDVKCADWLGGDYEKYLRPTTLFQSGKFDGYLNQKGVGKNGRFENTASAVGGSVGTWL
jgi:uncharacterized phage protein (TIGR02220 family)